MITKHVGDSVMATSNNTKHYYFFIGTEAELIKLFPVLLIFIRKKIPYTIIASGQNNLQKSDIYKLLKRSDNDIFLSTKNITQTSAGLFLWFIKTLIRGGVKLKSEFAHKNKTGTTLIVHGDTISTVMGALIGRFYGLKVAHIEAGLRSFNYFQPFPEEIDRIITSRLAAVHFCPNTWAANNLQNHRGEKINTEQNTLLDSLEIALKQSSIDEFKKIEANVHDKKYFIFVLHRQENLMNESLVRALVKQVEIVSNTIPCLFVLHKPTALALERLQLRTRLENNKHIMLLPRVSYFTFMKLLDKAEFIITDGGSNQEEAYYFGKPCLILRNTTERKEGLGENVVLTAKDPSKVQHFIEHYKIYKRPKVKTKVKPSEIIAHYLID